MCFSECYYFSFTLPDRSPHARVLKGCMFESFAVLLGPLSSQTSMWCFGKTSLTPAQLLPATADSTVCLPAEILLPGRLAVSLDGTLTRWLKPASLWAPDPQETHASGQEISGVQAPPPTLHSLPYVLSLGFVFLVFVFVFCRSQLCTE